MSRIVFFCIPAQGHTNPTLGVVRELVGRGHQVWYYSYEQLRDKIEEAGAVFVSCDKLSDGLAPSAGDGERVGKDLALATRLLTDMTLAMDDELCADMERVKPDCMVVDSMAV